MPVKWGAPGSDKDFVIVCQQAYSLCGGEGDDPLVPRFLIMFMSGEFTLDEANAFAIEALDNAVVPKSEDFFENDVEVIATAFSVPTIPMRLLVNTFSTIDFIDEYTFFLMRLEVEKFFKALTDAEERDLRRAKKARRDRRRLGIPVVAGTSAAELRRSRLIFQATYGD